jgi:hypothetical protein
MGIQRSQKRQMNQEKTTNDRDELVILYEAQWRRLLDTAWEVPQQVEKPRGSGKTRPIDLAARYILLLWGGLHPAELDSEDSHLEGDPGALTNVSPFERFWVGVRCRSGERCVHLPPNVTIMLRFLKRSGRLQYKKPGVGKPDYHRWIHAEARLHGKAGFLDSGPWGRWSLKSLRHTCLNMYYEACNRDPCLTAAYAGSVSGTQFMNILRPKVHQCGRQTLYVSLSRWYRTLPKTIRYRPNGVDLEPNIRLPYWFSAK